MYYTIIEHSLCVNFLQNLLSWIRLRIGSAFFYLLDPDPHSEKLLDPEKLNADPQPRPLKMQGGGGRK